MSLTRLRARIPIGVQVGAVAALFVAALMVLWTTGASVVARERRRSEARRMLDRADDELAARCLDAIASLGNDFDYREESDRMRLDATLKERARVALRAFERVEGGYFVSYYESFMGTVVEHPLPPGTPAAEPVAAVGRSSFRRGQEGLPPREIDLIEILVHAAIRKKQPLLSIEELEGAGPMTVAIRTAPIEAKTGDRVLGATWAMIRLEDSPFGDRSLRGYQLSAGLALGGIALAFVLTAGLARTVRRQAIERERLQTELRRSERLAALGKLLAGVAHEVRNPLAGIRSTAQLWQRGVVGLDEESLGNLVHEVDRLEEIVSRLLQFSRADAQDLVPGDLNGVVAEAARLASGPAESRGVKVELELDPGLPSVEMASPALLQIFRNLTTNAVQAMDAGGTLRLTTRRDPSRRTIAASVIDTGPGLADDTVEHLFEPFYTTKAEGTGLGLAIAREIALAHRGELRAANRADGRGAVFTLILPAADANSNGAVH
ncbi:MAG: sensor histidine kinase [Isosphaeraceae bacterium]